MSRLKGSLAILLSLLALVLIQPSIGVEGYPRTVVDIADRSVILEAPAEKIVLLHEYAVEPIYLLGEGDRVVGVTTATKQQLYPWLEGMDEKSEVGTYREHDYERIIELSPDVVVALPRYVEANAEMLKDTGITVIALGFENPADFEREFIALSEIVDRRDEAEKYLSWREEKLDLVQEMTADLKADERKKVYCEWSDWPLHTGSKGTGKDAVISLAGGTNIASELPILHPEVSPEWILTENPDAMLFSSSATFTPTQLTGYYITSTGNIMSFLSETRNRQEVKGTTAGKEDTLIILDEICVETTRNFIGVLYLAKWLYPEQFEDLDPDRVHREYFERWLGVPYEGIWAYATG